MAFSFSADLSPISTGVNLQRIQQMIDTLYPAIRNREEEHMRDTQNMEMFNRRNRSADIAKSIAMNQSQNRSVSGIPKNTQFGGYLPSPLTAMRSDDLKEKAVNADIASDKEKNDLARFKLEHPDLSVLSPAGGDFQSFNPLTGKITSTGVPTGTITDADKALLAERYKADDFNRQAAADLNRDRLRGNQEMQRVMAQIAANRDLQNMRGESAANVQNLRNAGNVNKPRSASDTKTERMNTFNEIKNTRPDLAKYLSLDADGNIVIKQQGTSFFGLGPNTGPSDDQMRELKNLIYGQGEDIFLPSKYSVVQDDRPKSKSNGSVLKSASENKKSDPLGIR